MCGKQCRKSAVLSGTVVGFVKGEFRIKLHYDEPLCRQLEDTTKENQPVFTKGRHYRPDIRMDLYREDVYWSTIIFEVKYRVSFRIKQKSRIGIRSHFVKIKFGDIKMNFIQNTAEGWMKILCFAN